MASENGHYAGLLVDWGGVLTTDLFASFRSFCELDGLEPDTVGVYDRVTTRAAGQQVFQLVTPAMPAIASASPPTVATLAAANHTLTVNTVIAPAGTTASVYDFKKNDMDFSAGFPPDFSSGPAAGASGGLGADLSSPSSGAGGRPSGTSSRVTESCGPRRSAARWAKTTASSSELEASRLAP